VAAFPIAVEALAWLKREGLKIQHRLAPRLVSMKLLWPIYPLVGDAERSRRGGET
jgi:hypothetical protein